MVSRNMGGAGGGVAFPQYDGDSRRCLVKPARRRGFRGDKRHIRHHTFGRAARRAVLSVRIGAVHDVGTQGIYVLPPRRFHLLGDDIHGGRASGHRRGGMFRLPQPGCVHIHGVHRRCAGADGRDVRAVLRGVAPLYERQDGVRPLQSVRGSILHRAGTADRRAVLDVPSRFRRLGAQRATA